MDKKKKNTFPIANIETSLLNYECFTKRDKKEIILLVLILGLTLCDLIIYITQVEPFIYFYIPIAIVVIGILIYYNIFTNIVLKITENKLIIHSPKGTREIGFKNIKEIKNNHNQFTLILKEDDSISFNCSNKELYDLLKKGAFGI